VIGHGFSILSQSDIGDQFLINTAARDIPVVIYCGQALSDRLAVVEQGRGSLFQATGWAIGIVPLIADFVVVLHFASSFQRPGVALLAASLFEEAVRPCHVPGCLLVKIPAAFCY